MYIVLRSAVFLLFLGIPFATSAQGTAPPLATEDCFTVASQKDIPFKIMQSAPPPIAAKSGAMRERSKYYPATDFISTNLPKLTQPVIDDLATSTKYGTYHMVWGNRCIEFANDGEFCRGKIRKGNWYRDMLTISFNGDPAYEVRPAFRSYQKANVCTMMQVAHALGTEPARIEDMGADARLTSVFRHAADTAALAPHVTQHTFADGQKHAYFIDVCILPERASADPKGIAIDYEVHDHRPVDVTTRLFERLAQRIHAAGKELMIYTNSLNSIMPNKVSGIDETNLARLIDLSDRFSFIVWSGASDDPDGHDQPISPRRWLPADNMKEQIRILAATPGTANSNSAAKLFPAVSLFDLKPEEAVAIRDMVISHGMGGIKLWRNGVEQGGPCSTPVNLAITNLIHNEK